MHSPTDPSTHVLIISQIYPPDLGGSGTRAFNVAKGLARKGYRITIVAGVPHYPTGNIPSEYRWKPYIVEYQDSLRTFRTFQPPMPSKGILRRLVLIFSFMVSSLFPLLQVGKVDVVFSSNPQIFAVFPGTIYGRLSSAGVVLNVDDLWPESLTDLGMLQSRSGLAIGRGIARFAYKLADHVVAISQAYVSVIRDKYGVPDQKITVVGGGVDLQLFSQTDPASGVEDGFEVLYIGALSTAYDFDQVLEAAKRLEDVAGVRFTIRGAGELGSVIRERMKELGSRNVSIVEKTVSRGEVARLMMRAGALLLPLSGLESVELGISSKLYEYQAAGRPVICCSRGMPGRYIKETGSGLVVEPRDAKGLAEAVLVLRGNESYARTLGLNGRKYVEDKMSVDGVGEQIGRVLKGI